MFYLPIFISDGEQPVQTSTSTLTIRVCSCDPEGNVMSCNAEAYSLPASLSRGALIAILACIFVLLGESSPSGRAGVGGGSRPATGEVSFAESCRLAGCDSCSVW